jgi:hypothetical protein
LNSRVCLLTIKQIPSVYTISERKNGQIISTGHSSALHLWNVNRVSFFDITFRGDFSRLCSSLECNKESLSVSFHPDDSIANPSEISEKLRNFIFGILFTCNRSALQLLRIEYKEKERIFEVSCSDEIVIHHLCAGVTALLYPPPSLKMLFDLPKELPID